MPTEIPDKAVREFQQACSDINFLFFVVSKQGQMEYRDHWQKRSTEENIKWVSRDKTQRRRFRRIMECIDEKDPARTAALVLRAFSGLQLFPDANHRTGLVIMGALSHRMGYRFQAQPKEMATVVENIRSEYGPLSARRTADKLLVEDDCLDFLSRFMQNHIRKLTLRERIRFRFWPNKGFQEFGKDLPLKIAPETPEEEKRRKNG